MTASPGEIKRITNPFKHPERVPVFCSVKLANTWEQNKHRLSQKKDAEKQIAAIEQLLQADTKTYVCRNCNTEHYNADGNDSLQHCWRALGILLYLS